MNLKKLGEYAKFIVAILTVAVSAVAQFAVPIPDNAIAWVQLVIAVLGAIAVYGVPNTPAYRAAKTEGE